MPDEVSSLEFHTYNLFFDAWLHCGRASYHRHSISFLRAQRRIATSTQKVFVFSDPENQIPELENEFKKNPPVRIITLRNAVNFLHDRMREVDQQDQNDGGAQ
jgi:hypothetical protein